MHIYETSHEPEALGLSKALSSLSKIAPVYLLEYILPNLAKLSRAIQSNHLDHTLNSSLVEASFNKLDNPILSSENWVLQLQDTREELKAATGIDLIHLDIRAFQEIDGKPFIGLIKDYISNRFRSSSKDALLAFSNFDPKKVPNLSSELTLY